MRRQALHKRWVAVAVMAVELTTADAWAAPAPVRVQVTGDALDQKHAKVVGPRVRNTAEGVLREEHSVPIAEDATTVVSVELRPIVEPKDHDKVIFRVTVLADDEEIYAGQPTSCWGCDEAKLLAAVRTQVAGVVEHLPEQAEASAPQEPATPASDGPPGDTATNDDEQRGGGSAPTSDAPKSAAPLTLRNVGIGLAVAGGALAVAGVGLIVAKERVVAGGNEERTTVREFRPTGVALAVAGGAVLVGGVVALALHGSRTKRAKRTAWAPSAGPGFLGFVVERRF